MTTLSPAAFFFDLSNELEVAKFPEDFADWLMDEGREQDAREFLAKYKHFETVTPGEELSVEAVIEIAEEYAPVVSFQDELREPKRTYAETLQLLKDAEAADEPTSDTPSLSWSREAALVNQMLADSTPVLPVDLDAHEFPDVTVYVDDDDSILHILANTVLALVEEGYVTGARAFTRDLMALTRTPVTDFELFTLIWSYVDVLPEIGSAREAQFTRKMRG